MFFAVLKKKWVMVVALSLVTVILLSLFTCGKTTGVFLNSTKRQLPIYRVRTEEKKLAISFDCAWGVDYTDTLLSVMQGEEVRCTFFAVEFWTKKYPEYVKKISDFGHEIGTHSATHPYMSKLDKGAIEKELLSSKSEIESLTGKTVELFRPPYGDYDDLLIETAKELGLYTVQWDVDSLDWKDISASEITSRVLKKVKNGSIVLFHNQGKHTAEALPSIITALKTQGYTLVPIGELIYKTDYYMASDGEQIHV